VTAIFQDRRDSCAILLCMLADMAGSHVCDAAASAQLAHAHTSQATKIGVRPGCGLYTHAGEQDRAHFAATYA
jgi:hypothetical protein